MKAFDILSTTKLEFVFEPNDDILDYAKKYVKDKEEREEKEFEEKMSKGVHFKGDIVITDPCYFEYWQKVLEISILKAFKLVFKKYF